MTFSSMEHKARNSAELPSCSWLDRPKLLFNENAIVLTAPAHWDDFTVMNRAAQKKYISTERKSNNVVQHEGE